LITFFVEKPNIDILLLVDYLVEECTQGCLWETVSPGEVSNTISEGYDIVVVLDWVIHFYILFWFGCIITDDHS
jgi:hypothetical protein